MVTWDQITIGTISAVLGISVMYLLYNILPGAAVVGIIGLIIIGIASHAFVHSFHR